MSKPYHIPVLLHQSIQSLITNPSGIYVDATFGGGGHSREILNRLKPDAKLFAFDQDKDAGQNKIDDTRFHFIPHNFRYIQKFLRMAEIREVDGILADLGVSSHQFDEAERGFSIRNNAPLDMRMDNKTEVSAKTVVNQYSEEQLQHMFSAHAELRNAKQLAHAIVEQRKVNAIETTFDLLRIAEKVMKGERHKYAAQVFQAIRIEVNDEMGALKEMLLSANQLLKPGGRLVVISYHSLEDRIVKNIIKTGNAEGIEEEDIMGRKKKYFINITKKPV
ncbi:MAG: 16S rRNA (cytosine(1402)-N(4))-methyltransferase RsmH, partial [Chitinophagales bacterium]|nr:16S rRNA (cytosine(1402)-N(4))-methyltransferase RsmH [Chitinophagales bacterium]